MRFCNNSVELLLPETQSYDQLLLKFVSSKYKVANEVDVIH